MVSVLFSLDGADGRLPRTTEGEPASSVQTPKKPANALDAGRGDEAVIAS